MEKNSYSYPVSTDTLDDDTQPRLPRQGVSTSPTGYTQHYQERAARSANIYEQQTRLLPHGSGVYPQNGLAMRQAPSQSASNAPLQQPRKGARGAPRMAKEQALRITRGLKKAVVVASVLSLGTFAALAEIHTLNTPTVQAAPPRHSSSTTTGSSKSTGPTLGPPDKTSATPSNTGGSSSTSQSGTNSNQNGNGGFNFGSGNSQGPATGSNVS